MKHLFIALVLFLGLASVPACNTKTAEKTEEAATTETTETTGTEASEQLAYICPMECVGSASNEPGKCKVCGMDLVKNPKHAEHGAATDTTSGK